VRHDSSGCLSVMLQIHFGFDCGTDPLYLVSKENYNDGKWHKLNVVRDQQLGKLFIDDLEIDVGESPGTGKTLIMQSPFYYGGIDKVTEQIKYNLKVLFYRRECRVVVMPFIFSIRMLLLRLTVV
jgi:hypothetical protein